MSTLLLELNGSMTFNRTIFPPYLFIFDDLLIYKRRRWFRVREVTIAYNQIAQIIVTRGIFFATIEIITNGNDNITIKFVPREKGMQAKKIIDQKIFYSHAKHKPGDRKEMSNVFLYEKSLARLNELYNRGSISKDEYEERKREILRKNT